MEEKQTFYEWLNNLIEPAKEWIASNDRNPFFWIGVVVAVLAAFGLAYNALHKNK
jgi:hypothetical protein